MTATLTLTEFLLARIAEDEAAARAAAEHRLSLGSHPDLAMHLSAIGPAGERWSCRYDTVNATHEDGGRAGGIAYVGNFGMDLVRHIARHDPARVLAECEAKRRIVETLASAESRADVEWQDYSDWIEGKAPDRRPVFPGPDRDLIPGLRIAAQALAAVYADHPDYRDEWRP